MSGMLQQRLSIRKATGTNLCAKKNTAKKNLDTQNHIRATLRKGKTNKTTKL